MELWPIRRLSSALLATTLAGCSVFGSANGPVEVSAPRPVAAYQPAPRTPALYEAELLRFVAEEGAGVQTVLSDGRGRILYHVTIEETYFSASGRTCRRLMLEPQRTNGPRAIWRVACKGKDGWYVATPLKTDGAGG